MFSKLFQIAKMSWMLFWRFAILSVLFNGGRDTGMFFWVAFGIAAVSVLIFNRTLLTWPIAKLLFFRVPVYVPVVGGAPRGSQRTRTATPPKTVTPKGNLFPGTRPGAVTPMPPGKILETATANGTMTGFEPSALASMAVPRKFTMAGVPGAGLHGATHFTQSNINLGVQGEENFAKALAMVGAIDRFNTAWSVPVPAMDSFRPGDYDTDIDCVVATSTALFLVDLKNYKSGGVRYYHHGDYLYCQDNVTGQPVGSPKHMSRNMEMATAAVRQHFPEVNVVPVVVFMPTDKGEGTIENVLWPGGVPAMNLREFLDVLATQQGTVGGARSDANHALTRLSLLSGKTKLKR